MKTEKLIVVKKRKGAGRRRRGPLPSVSGNRNVDRRRRLPSAVRPTWLWDGGINIFGNDSTTIFFPYVGTFGSLRGPWWRKDGDVLILSLFSKGTVTISGDWQEVSESPFSTLGGEVRVLWREWRTGDPETLTVSADDDTQGVLQAWRNVSTTDLFSEIATAEHTTDAFSMPSLSVGKNGAYYGVLFQEPLPSIEDDNVVDADSAKLDYLTKYWDTGFASVPANIGILSGSASKPVLASDISVITREALPSFALASSLPAIKTTRATIGQSFRPSYVVPYYANNLSAFQPIFNVGDIALVVLRGGDDRTPFSTWSIQEVSDQFNGEQVSIATKEIKSLDESISRVDLVLKGAALKPQIISTQTGTGPSAIAESLSAGDGELIVTFALALTPFFPAPTAIGLSEFSSEKGPNDLYITTGYGQGLASSVTFPLFTVSEWLTARLKFRKL